ncbi:ABC transporter permease subunit [Bacillus salipaludis]|uniref:ABC transporter permease subunit n=1 Tax=Bacillus salipaludis TaxID=2547811 RepID=A0ABW8RDQ4_9BACI
MICLPSLVSFNPGEGGIGLNLGQFEKTILGILQSFFHKQEVSQLLNYFQGEGMHKYFYTMSILSISLLIVAVVGMMVSILIIMLPRKLRKRIVSLVDFTTTAPELLIIFLLQFLMIYMYRTYDIRLFRLYGYFNNEPYFMPIFIVSFLPAFFFIQLVVKEFTNEENKDYVLFARSKGLPYRFIYIKHIIRNIIPLFYSHFRTIVWFSLTNIYVVETLFAINGYIQGLSMIAGQSAAAYIIGLVLFALPLIIANVIAALATAIMNRKEQISI